MAAGISTRKRATMEKSSIFVEVESLCGATSYPLRTPRLEDTVLDAHTREPITVITERYLGVLRFCRWSQPGHNQKLAHLISEIGVERSHLMFCTNCHKIDITTGYCSWVEIRPYSRPGSSEVPRNPLTRWDVSSIPANGIFLTKKLENKNKNAQRVEND